MIVERILKQKIKNKEKNQSWMKLMYKTCWTIVQKINDPN